MCKIYEGCNEYYYFTAAHSFKFTSSSGSLPREALTIYGDVGCCWGWRQRILMGDIATQPGRISSWPLNEAISRRRPQNESVSQPYCAHYFQSSSWWMTLLLDQLSCCEGCINSSEEQWLKSTPAFVRSINTNFIAGSLAFHDHRSFSDVLAASSSEADYYYMAFSNNTYIYRVYVRCRSMCTQRGHFHADNKLSW